MACQRRFKNSEGRYEADFISCVAWRQTAELIEKFFKKGNKIGVLGSLQTRTYDKDGQKHYVTEVLVDNVEFVTPANGERAASTQPPSPSTPTGGGYDEMTPADDDDDLPF